MIDRQIPLHQSPALSESTEAREVQLRVALSQTPNASFDAERIGAATTLQRTRYRSTQCKHWDDGSTRDWYLGNDASHMYITVVS
jgi:hypothetical protein